jgi:poly-gamma-glutamate synthesis protein (capsule biosynthesis protein)
MCGNAASVRLIAVGDIMLGDSAICVGFGFASRHDSDGLRRLLSNVAPLLQDAQIGFGNLEAVLSGRGLDPDSLRSKQMRGLPEYATALRGAGFNVINVANNHAVQHGEEAFRDTVQALEMADIRVCGLRGEDGWCSRPVVMPVGAVTVGIIGYCLRPRQYGTTTPPFAEGAAEEIRADVTRLKSTVNQVIVSLHWGEEFVQQPCESEVALAKSLIDAGAAVIVGHHPHVARPVERHGNGVVGYSLGNFVSDMIWLGDLRAGKILRCELSARGVMTAETIDVRIGRDFGPTVTGVATPIVRGNTSQGLSELVYAANVRRSLTRQRLAAYSYAMRNLRKYPRRILGQMFYTSARNKLTALLQR